LFLSGLYPILATPTADYPYRVVVPKSLWATLLSELALEQSWSNFKNEVAAFQEEGGREYSQALHDVWARMARLARSSGAAKGSTAPADMNDAG
jgi:hypothetical protein